MGIIQTPDTGICSYHPKYFSASRILAYIPQSVKYNCNIINYLQVKTDISSAYVGVTTQK